jgi:hypothetical protein
MNEENWSVSPLVVPKLALSMALKGLRKRISKSTSKMKAQESIRRAVKERISGHHGQLLTKLNGVLQLNLSEEKAQEAKRPL